MYVLVIALASETLSDENISWKLPGRHVALPQRPWARLVQMQIQSVKAQVSATIAVKPGLSGAAFKCAANPNRLQSYNALIDQWVYS
jgi:hypothetical protein